ncbi:MAG TPA: TatD family hydrolase [Candidatus Saccharimonadia bacterium]
MIDTHAHIHFDSFAGQVDAMLHRAFEAGVEQMITVGVTTADSRKAVDLASTYENVWAAVGIHPHDAGEASQGIDYLRDLAGRRKVVAIGECGLDQVKSQTTAEEQEKALRLQIELAQERKLPLIFHIREAFEPFWAIIDDYPDVRGVVHSFSATRKEAEQVIERDMLLGINGIVSFPKSQDLGEAVKYLPSTHLLLETDCPFLSPVPFRGKTNEPARVTNIAEKIAELRGETLATVAAYSTANAKRLFSL